MSPEASPSLGTKLSSSAQPGAGKQGCSTSRRAREPLWEPASPLLFSFREAAASPANIYKEKTGFNLTVLGKEDADGVKGAFVTR